MKRGRPAKVIDLTRLVALRNGDPQHWSWRKLAKHLGAGVSTVRRAYEKARS